MDRLSVSDTRAKENQRKVIFVRWFLFCVRFLVTTMLSQGGWRSRNLVATFGREIALLLLLLLLLLLFLLCPTSVQIGGRYLLIF